jgi:hypothetical protein
MISPTGAVGASVSTSPPLQAQLCAPSVYAVLQPSVSATDDAVFYRFGDSRIRYVKPDGKTGEATSVPGGPTTVSFFSVSPDDQRIAVVVEDLANDPITLRLYVEDLTGGGHHVDVYSTTTPRSVDGTTLWPMGWHEGRLVLAVWPVCTVDTRNARGAYSPLAYPLAWHVVDPATGNREVSVGSNTCVPSYFPSRAGLACFDYIDHQIRIYDWTGRQTAVIAVSESAGYGLDLSPNGQVISFAAAAYPPPPQAVTTFVSVAMPNVRQGSTWTVPNPNGCKWIDDDHLLAISAVIDAKTALMTTVPVDGFCVGRFPGGL